MKFGYIYKTTCWLTGAVYVGQKRGDFHKGYFGSGKHLNLAINKYDLKNFSVEVIQYAKNQDELDSLERCCIATLRSVMHEEQIYNIADGGLKGIPRSGKFNNFYGSCRTGKLNPNWRGGVSNPHCMDCGKDIYYGFKRCKSCVGKLRPKSKFKAMAKKRGAPWNKGLRKNMEQQKIMEVSNGIK